MSSFGGQGLEMHDVEVSERMGEGLGAQPALGDLASALFRMRIAENDLDCVDWAHRVLLLRAP